MKVAIAFTVIVGLAIAAPAENAGPQETNNQRMKKSPPYGAPCAGPISAPPPLAPIALYLAAPSPPSPHYREVEHMGDATMERAARGYYDTGALAGLASSSASATSSASASSSASSISSSGSPSPNAVAAPAIGIFPNAKVSGCAIPLLLSCSPSIASGHLASHATPTYPAYRMQEMNQHNMEMKEAAMEKMLMENASHNENHHHRH